MSTHELFDPLWPSVAGALPPDLLAAIAAAAPEADSTGRLAEGSLELLRDSHWPGLAVPEQFGGRGAGLVECCAVQRALAAADAGLAVAVNMHLFSIGLMVEHWRRRTDVSWLLMEAIATQDRFLASAFAEPNLGGSVTRSIMRATKKPKSWVVSGRKTPCSLAGYADLVCLQVQTEQSANEPAEVLVALLPMTAPGLSVERTWDTLGMRGSASDTILLDDCEIPEELVFYRAPAGQEDDDIVAAGLVWFVLTATATYLGVAEAALAAAVPMLHKSKISHLGSSRAGLPSYQALVGQQVASLLALEAACSGLAAQMDAGADPNDVLPATLAVKQQSIDVIPAVVADIAETCGGLAYSQRSSLSRHWRDVQGVRFHPPVPPAARQFLGRRALGLRASLDLDESAAAPSEQLGSR